ncbi:MAG: 1-deoxy-D-xylulose-5-phosphate reductoisomerase [Gammaproteobacteria bacterium]|nr:1-deoxy-D-xylulose-5-phosphate reductoisomerase [Gammaproteobacteria bacterium]
MANAVQQVTILGSTGSIGVNTLDVIARHPDRFVVHALTAWRSVQAIFEQCLQYRPRLAVMSAVAEAGELSERLRAAGSDTRVLAGAEGLCEVAAAAEVDVVMAAIVGAVGLEPTLAAVRAGKRVLLANKESLVMAGKLFMDTVLEHGATLLPIDSEHNAIYQCLPVDGEGRAGKTGVSKILLTASGGPFRLWSLDQMRVATPDQACAHPNWEMGRKISVDSATLMNKGLELIEARWLFNLDVDAIEVVVHPQSIVHSMVQYVDGSVLAQLGNPDMRTPIAYGLAWPDRIGSGVAELDIIAVAQLDFEAPDYQRFPCLGLARGAVRRGGLAMASLNAANEEAVAAFLEGKIGFTAIPDIIETVLAQTDSSEPDSLDEVKQADAFARERALAAIDVL